MIINVYKCDLCKKEFRDAKDIYEAKNGLCMDIKGLLKMRYKVSEACTECFNIVRSGIHEAISAVIK